jgi:hypothetical protein
MHFRKGFEHSGNAFQSLRLERLGSIEKVLHDAFEFFNTKILFKRIYYLVHFC